MMSLPMLLSNVKRLVRHCRRAAYRVIACAFASNAK